MTKEQYDNEQYNPLVYPSTIPAFSSRSANPVDHKVYNMGMTLFDHYAGQAMQSNIRSVDPHDVAERLLDARAKILGIKIPKK